MMYTPRRSTKPLPRRSLLSKCPTGLRYALTCNSIKKSKACFNKTRSSLKALEIVYAKFNPNRSEKWTGHL
jgi:hypothetical protein